MIAQANLHDTPPTDPRLSVLNYNIRSVAISPRNASSSRSPSSTEPLKTSPTSSPATENTITAKSITQSESCDGLKEPQREPQSVSSHSDAATNQGPCGKGSIANGSKVQAETDSSISARCATSTISTTGKSPKMWTAEEENCRKSAA